jgi:hypothetical protein
LRQSTPARPEARKTIPRTAPTACGSLARRFEQLITDQIALSNGGTATDALSVTKTDGSATIAHAEPATLAVTAHDAIVSVQAHAEVAEGVGEAHRRPSRPAAAQRCSRLAPKVGRAASGDPGASSTTWWCRGEAGGGPN